MVYSYIRDNVAQLVVEHKKDSVLVEQVQLFTVVNIFFFFSQNSCSHCYILIEILISSIPNTVVGWGRCYTVVVVVAELVVEHQKVVVLTVQQVLLFAVVAEFVANVAVACFAVVAATKLVAAVVASADFVSSVAVFAAMELAGFACKKIGVVAGSGWGPSDCIHLEPSGSYWVPAYFLVAC